VVRVHPTVPNQLNSSLVQRLFDAPDVFAPQKIQKALQMALRMVGLSRAKDGRWCSDFGPTPRTLANWTPRIETRTVTSGDGLTFRWKLSWLSDKNRQPSSKSG
jgi:hypothetical protein